MSQTNLHKEFDEIQKFLADVSIAPADRADALLYWITDQPLDHRPTLRALLEQADVGTALREKQKAQEGRSLVVEYFLGSCELPSHVGLPMAKVPRGPTDVVMQASPEILDGLQCGDPVLVDAKNEQLVGRDGRMPLSGEVVTVESQPPELPQQIIVNHHDRQQLARLHHHLSQDPTKCRPGTRVLYEPVRRIVLRSVDTCSSGQELLVDPARLRTIREADIGSPKPVVQEIMARIRLMVEHPEWTATMGVRDRCSYIFSGGTGTGKSFNLQYLATEVHDYVEDLTGRRESRLVMLDASHLLSSWFGGTEQNIAAWTQKIERLGSRRLLTRDGREVRFPLIVVLEECEGLIRSRSEMQSSSHLYDRPLALLLQKTESLEHALGVPIIWIITTNRADLTDAAALRRLGMRKVVFGSLRAAEALAVLHKKLTVGMPIRGQGTCQTNVREAFVNKVLGYLYGPEPKQALVEVQLASSQRRLLNRGDLVTPAVLEEAISYGVDRCLRKSAKAGQLLGLESKDVISFLHEHFTNLSQTLRPHNLAEHCAEWTSHDHVTNVVPLVQEHRLPRALLMD